MKKYTLDRFDEDKAVLEDENGDFKTVLLSLIPNGAKEGDALSFENGEFSILPDETKKRREHIKNLRKLLSE